MYHEHESLITFVEESLADYEKEITSEYVKKLINKSPSIEAMPIEEVNELKDAWFLGGMSVGIIICVALFVTGIILWKKVIKKKVDDAIFKAGLKAIEKQKENKL